LNPYVIVWRLKPPYRGEEPMDNYNEIKRRLEQHHDLEPWLWCFQQGRKAITDGNLSEAHTYLIQGIKLVGAMDTCPHWAGMMFLDLAEVYFVMQQPVASKKALDHAVLTLCTELLRYEAIVLRCVRLYNELGHRTRARIMLKEAILVAGEAGDSSQGLWLEHQHMDTKENELLSLMTDLYSITLAVGLE
jgi:hypothetical protein